ncbi:MAG: hypothetical protein ABI317_12615, partial [Gaiellales bacterium]
RRGSATDVASSRDVVHDAALRRSLDEALALLGASGISAAATAVVGDPAVAICAALRATPPI